MSPFLTCDVAFQHFFFERLVGIKDYNSWRCLSRAFFQCFVNGSVVRRRFSTYWMIALAWLQKWWWEHTAWKAQERSKEGYFMILWSIIGSYTFWVHANSIWQWSEGRKRWRKSERASSKGASKHILHFDMGIVPQGMLRPQFNMSAYCTTFTILQSNTIITTRSGQGQTNLPLHPPRFGLVKITGGLIENMILRKTRALASAPGTAIGDGEPVEHLQHCSSSRLCTQSKLTTPFQRSKFGGASKWRSCSWHVEKRTSIRCIVVKRESCQQSWIEKHPIKHVSKFIRKSSKVPDITRTYKKVFHVEKQIEALLWRLVGWHR